MTDVFNELGWARGRGMLARLRAVLTNAAKAAGPPLLFGLRLWASVCLALYVAFWLELDNAFWAGTSAARGVPADWMADPVRLRRTCEGAARTLTTLPAGTPSLRLLADQTAKVLAGISDALNGLALLVGAPIRSVRRLGGVQIRVPDWLPSLVNAGRAFVAIGIVELFWIVTEWPNGAFAIVFTAVGVLLFAPRADQAYATAKSFMVGNALATVFTAIIAFAVLPGLETFEAFSLAIGLYLIPIGALTAQPWQTLMFTAMVINFVPLLAPANEMSYDTVQFYNGALAIVAGSGGTPAPGCLWKLPLGRSALRLRKSKKLARGLRKGARL